MGSEVWLLTLICYLGGLGLLAGEAGEDWTEAPRGREAAGGGGRENASVRARADNARHERGLRDWAGRDS